MEVTRNMFSVLVGKWVTITFQKPGFDLFTKTLLIRDVFDTFFVASGHSMLCFSYSYDDKYMKILEVRIDPTTQPLKQ